MFVSIVACWSAALRDLTVGYAPSAPAKLCSTLWGLPDSRSRRTIPYFLLYRHRYGRTCLPRNAQNDGALTNYDWPGNIRELQNVIERSVILTNGPELRVAMPEFNSKSPAAAPHHQTSNLSGAGERARILEALKEANGQVGGPDGAAARLAMKRTTLQSRMRKYNIARQFQ
jgi:formate hydrogenlyase transcriptional activator